jgi:alpha-tubulin suppressor-like RCC1 family protein
VYAWGDNSKGAVGTGSTASVQPTPVTVPGLGTVTAVATGHYHSLALLSDGSARAWGFGTAGQLGNGAFATQRSPVTVMLNKTTRLTGISKLAGGRAHSLAIVGGRVYAWGDNTYGQLGNGTQTRSGYPVPVSIPVAIKDVAGGRDHTLAVGVDGSLWAWGRNDYGQLGTGSKTVQLRPVKLNVSGMADVEAGAFHSLALTTSGNVLAWGRNNYGQLGVGSTVTKLTPMAVPGLSGIAEIACGRDHTLAIRADKTVVAWGLNDAGQLDDGTKTNRTKPVTMLGIGNAFGVTAGRGYTDVLAAG